MPRSHSEKPLACGLDEAGRGPLAGPVYAAAVILDPTRPIAGLNDSKALSAKKRGLLEREIMEKALFWKVSLASREEIDELNILHASMLAMERCGLEAQSRFGEPNVEFLVDGNRSPKALAERSRAIVGGDALEPCIMAASILAKEARDRALAKMENDYPGYGFAKHKGYPTKDHLAAIEQLGVCAEHRRSYGPVKKALGLK